MRGRIALALGTAAALGVAAPATGATVEVKALDTPAWDKPEVRIAAGDTVTWTFLGTGSLHNVQSSSPNWSFESPVGAPAPTATAPPFTTPGAYDYVCRIHAQMTGRVLVGDAPPPPPPPPGQQPLPNDSPDVGDVETGAFDATGPRLRDVRVRRRAGGARVSLRVSERARVTVRVVRRGRTVKTEHASGAGRLRLTVAGKGLRAGRYRVVVRAVDLAGNPSSARSARITLR
jgi:plastocyanin